MRNSIKPKVSIITVVYNSEQYIENTVKSVISQKYDNIEYIVIDGASKDNTLNILNSYKQNISTLVSEQDNGLYDAMNKAIKLATGDYLWFINSGDEIFSNDVLCKIFDGIDEKSQLPDIIYGETEIINQSRESVGMRRHSAPDKLTWKSLKFGMKVCHQSVIVKKSLASSYKTKYRYSSDFEWLIRALRQSENIYNSHLTLSKFMEGGISSQSLIPSLKERFSIMKQYYGLFSTSFIHLYLAIKLLFYYIKNKRF